MKISVLFYVGVISIVTLHRYFGQPFGSIENKNGICYTTNRQRKNCSI